jgi:hypothetical protein
LELDASLIILFLEKKIVVNFKEVKAGWSNSRRIRRTWQEGLWLNMSCFANNDNNYTFNMFKSKTNYSQVAAIKQEAKYIYIYIISDIKNCDFYEICISLDDLLLMLDSNSQSLRLET